MKGYKYNYRLILFQSELRTIKHKQNLNKTNEKLRIYVQ